MVDFWKSWRGEYNDAALQTEKKGQKNHVNLETKKQNQHKYSLWRLKY